MKKLFATLRTLFGKNLVEKSQRSAWDRKFKRLAIELFWDAFPDANSDQVQVIRWPQSLSDGPYMIVGYSDHSGDYWIRVAPHGWWEAVPGYWTRGKYDPAADGLAKWRSSGEPQRWASDQLMDHAEARHLSVSEADINKGKASC